MTQLSPFYTDDRTAKAILSAAKDHLAKPVDGHVSGAGAGGVTTQFQNTCPFKLAADWKELSASNFVASGEKISPLAVGAEKRPYPTTIYAYGERPTSGKDSMIVATRRANRWVLLPTGTAGEAAPSSPKVRLVQPKELFPACEYKTLQDVYGCALEYSDDGESWIPIGYFNCGIRGVVEFHQHEFPLEPHKYWRGNLKGFIKPEDPNDEYADRGFYTFGRLWEAFFWIERKVETQKTVAETEYTFTANVSDHWKINTCEPLAVDLSLSPEVSDGELFYKPSSGDWKSLGAFTSPTTVLTAADFLIDDEKNNRLVA